jgi:hypothetical protein
MELAETAGISFQTKLLSKFSRKDDSMEIDSLPRYSTGHSMQKSIVLSLLGNSMYGSIDPVTAAWDGSD